jgi:branched-chain amino acid transport system permease protein
VAAVSAARAGLDAAARLADQPRRLAALALVAALVAPLVLPTTYHVNVLVTAGLFVLLALSLDLLLGFTGYLSLAHHGLWAVGAYTTALLTTSHGLGVWPALAAAPLVAGGVAAALAVPAFRVRGHYFALVTLAMGELIRITLLNWVPVTQGPFGVTGIPRPALPGLGVLDGRLSYYYLVLAAVVVVLAAVVRVLGSPLGRSLVAVREDEELAEAQGLWLMPYKVVAFACSGAIAGLAGGLFASYQGVIGPNNFTIQYMAEMLVMLIVGGSGVVAGSVVGPLVFVPLPELTRVLGDARLLVFGLILVGIVIWAPEGVAGRLRDRLADRREAGPETGGE